MVSRAATQMGSSEASRRSTKIAAPIIVSDTITGASTGPDQGTGKRNSRSQVHGEAGQSTAEYALVILGAVAIATLLITWATGSHAISQLFDSVIEKILPS